MLTRLSALIIIIAFSGVSTTAIASIHITDSFEVTGKATGDTLGPTPHRVVENQTKEPGISGHIEEVISFTGIPEKADNIFEASAGFLGFHTSQTSSSKNLAKDRNRPAIDMEADHNMQAYYLPLDGRQFDDALYGGSGKFDMPLSNLQPLGREAYESLTGGSYADHPRGVTKVTAVQNDGSGTILAGVFDSRVLGKTFVALDAHLSGDLGDYIDEFMPNAMGPRYAIVIDYDTVNGSWVCVDFEYNGGNPTTPQDTPNCLSYIGYDNTSEWAAVVSDWQRLTRPTDVIGKPLSRDGYVLSAYYIREFTQVPLNIAKDFYIGTADGSPMRIKHGVEGRYLGAVQHFGGPTHWKDPKDLFLATDYANTCVSHNVEWISAHKTYKPTYKYMVDGNISTGMFMCVGNYTKREWDELSNGYGFDADELLWTMGSNGLQCKGATTGSGPTRDVGQFGFNVHINCDYDGPNVLGQTGGSTRGMHYNVFHNTTVNFNPQSKWVPSHQRLRLRFTTDFSNINNTGDRFDPATHTDYLPSHAVETDDGDFYATRYMGGNSRKSIIHIDRFIFGFNHPRYNQIDSYYNLCYNNNKTQTLPPGSTPSYGQWSAGKYTCSNKKALIEWEIPKSGEVITLQRQVNLKQPRPGVTETTATPTINAYSHNSVVTQVNWGLTLQKRAEDFTAQELRYIFPKKPHEVQVGDTFKILAWVEVDDDTGFAEGQKVTVRDASNKVLTEGTVQEVDNLLYTRRIKIKGADANVQLADNITNGSQTSKVTAASNFDPTRLYSFMRQQGGKYSERWDPGLASGGTATGPVIGSGDGYGTGFAQSKKRRIEGYVPWVWIVAPDLPDTINGAEGNNDENTTNVIFDVEMVTSAAEVLLDGKYRDGVLSYIGHQRIGTDRTSSYWLEIDEVSKRVPFVNRGVGLSYKGGPDNAQTGFLTPSDFPITISDPQGHASYNRAEITWYIRMPKGWQNTPYRQSLANMGNNSAPRYGGDTAYKTKDLSKYSKGIVLVGEVSGLGRLLMAESGSSRDQFNRSDAIYDANPSYMPQYAIDEEMIPPNETGPFRPKVRVYGQTAIDWVSGLGKANSYHYATQTDANEANAPKLPKSVREVLAALGESF